MGTSMRNIEDLTVTPEALQTTIRGAGLPETGDQRPGSGSVLTRRRVAPLGDAILAAGIGRRAPGFTLMGACDDMRMKESATGRKAWPGGFEADALSLVDALYRTARRLTKTPADAED